MKYILSVDQGTTASRAIIFDENQKVIAESQREYKSYPKDGWVEANPRTILDTVKEVINEVLTTTGVKVMLALQINASRLLYGINTLVKKFTLR